MVSAVGRVEKEHSFFFLHLLKLILKMVFGNLVPSNWALPRGEHGESWKQISVAVFCG